MLSKLFKGEFSLAATFWKFGVLGLIILHFALRMFASLLSVHLKGRTIYDFFMHHFHFVYSSKMSILWALCYMSTFAVMIFYSYNIILAVWRSGKTYDKSPLLVGLSRLGILVMVFLVWNRILIR